MLILRLLLFLLRFCIIGLTFEGRWWPVESPSKSESATAAVVETKLAVARVVEGTVNWAAHLGAGQGAERFGEYTKLQLLCWACHILWGLFVVFLRFEMFLIWWVIFSMVCFANIVWMLGIRASFELCFFLLSRFRGNRQALFVAADVYESFDGCLR